MDPIKEAFAKAKQEIQELKDQNSLIIKEIEYLKECIDFLISQNSNYDVKSNVSNRQTDKQTQNPTHIPTHEHDKLMINDPNTYDSPTDESLNQTDLNEQSNTYSKTSTDNMVYKGLKPHIYSISTGNWGVPTDKQTNRQTDTKPNTYSNTNPNTSYGKSKNDEIGHINDLSKLLDSLDNVKKELRNKFKRLTNQEMMVFSAIYQLEEEGFEVDYALIAKKLILSESSIRDYIIKIIRKGIPIQKLKENNKKIYLKISSDLKKISSLQTILELREI